MAGRSIVCGFLAFAFALLTVCDAARCPDGWIPHGEFCFLFKKETYNWFDALIVCERLGGYLAEDNSKDKHHFLVGLVQDHGLSNNMTWIGLEDFVEENIFVWDHSRLPLGETYWGPSEPQDWQGEEDCVALHRGMWDDLNCEDWHVPFICEMPAQEQELIG